jgi:hypothetical protein
LADIFDVRFSLNDVRFTPESGHVRCNWGCPLWAKSGPKSLRADEYRMLADSLHCAETRLKLLRVAADYDWMAMRAAAIEL